MSIPNHILEQLNSQADLVSIIGRHTTLKRAGNEFKGCCPFHGEKSPSFYVNPQKNIYHCFGCGVGGNAIGFLRDYENLSFMEAVDELSRQTGIEVPKDEQKNVSYQRTPIKAASKAPSIPSVPPDYSEQAPASAVPDRDAQAYPSDAAPMPDGAGIPMDAPPYPPMMDAGYADYADSDYSDDSYDDMSGMGYDDYLPAPMPDEQEHGADGNLYELLERIAAFYRQSLSSHPHAQHYFNSRGITDASLDTFMLGYAPFGWQHLEHAFPQDIEGLRALGLVRRSDSGRDYDLLRDRVIFPIRDNQGRVIGFAGRALDDEVKPKYINSSDSPVFHKQHVLYGYYESRQQRADSWLVVEGYMDVIALYQAGIYGAVASMGTAINESQISRLLTLNPTLTLCFDGDSAGQKAAWRTLEVSLPILSDDKELRFLTLPDAHDPDTYIKANSAEAMREQIRHAVPLSQYIYAYLSERYDLSLVEGKAKLMAQVKALSTALPKGSSFRYLLNNDIYQKLGGKRKASISAKDALLDFDGGMTVSQQLQLCFLYCPRALDTDVLLRIWQQAGIAQALPQHIKQKAPADALRPIAWADLQDAMLFEVVSTIQRCLPHLPADINAAAHFILANLSADTQAVLSRSWAEFYRTLAKHEVSNFDDLIDNLVTQVLNRHLQKKTQALISNPNPVTLAIVRKQSQCLNDWLRAKQAEQSAQMG
ncbi:DNA primase [Psychrobacter aestuarii]|uniref:DNA primase n=1 Tax=Psychrobacter aestuarii TaxID=556327 RepID=A0ABN0VX17_9GAMM|nr:CHC2 zinc finger domain-containing protein [Psychrobacter aestuarii]